MLGDDTHNTTEQRLRLLQAEFTQHQNRGPGTGRTATRTEAAAPLDLGVIDHIRAAVNELVTHTRAADPDTQAGPVPTAPADVIDWARDHTAHLDPERQQVREAIIYRQGLEHALAMGDDSVVRKHPCPRCGCWGLHWWPAANRAACVNHYCTDDGLTSTWTLARLATQYIAGKKSSAATAT
ncbi:hypothetical protein E6R18_32815 [Streptomyces sp. A1277]|uniref:hypothetical protein n=1 Tax=Streptomyces sp. A1277 TaxID=2563103 RepID=UPI0010A27690|nr:hypothetical protein [Streptomyces sp. A1277]THA22730.1 hypothetical protein E6R18_32815 [Streptomyces sp. A1277]